MSSSDAILRENRALKQQLSRALADGREQETEIRDLMVAVGDWERIQKDNETLQTDLDEYARTIGQQQHQIEELETCLVHTQTKLNTIEQTPHHIPNESDTVSALESYSSFDRDAALEQLASATATRDALLKHQNGLIRSQCNAESVISAMRGRVFGDLSSESNRLERAILSRLDTLRELEHARGALNEVIEIEEEEERQRQLREAETDALLAARERSDTDGSRVHERDALQNKVDELQTRVAVISDLETDLEAARQAEASLRAANEQLQRDCQARDGDLVAVKEQVNQLNVMLDHSREENVRIVSGRNSVAELEQLRHERNAHESDAATAKAELASSEARLANEVKTVHTLQTRVHELEEELETTRNSCKVERHKMQDAADAYEERQESHLSRITELEATCDRMMLTSGELDELKARYRVIEEDLMSCRNELETTCDDLAYRTAELDSVKDQLTVALADADEQRDLVDTCRRERAEELDALEKQRADSSAAMLTENSTSVEQLSKHLSQAEETVLAERHRGNEAVAALEKFKVEHDQITDEHIRRIEHFEEVVNDERRRADEAVVELQALKESHEADMGWKDEDHQVEVSRLRTELESSKSEVSLLAAALESTDTTDVGTVDQSVQVEAVSACDQSVQAVPVIASVSVMTDTVVENVVEDTVDNADLLSQVTEALEESLRQNAMLRSKLTATDVESVAATLASVRQERDALAHEVSRLSSEETKVEELRTELDAVNIAYSRAKSAIGERQRALDNMQGLLMHTEELAIQLERETATTKSLRDDNESLRQRIVDLSDDSVVSSLQNKVKQCEMQYSDLEIELRSTRSLCNDRTAQIKSLEKRLSERNEVLRVVQEENAAMWRRSGDMKDVGRHEDLRRENKELIVRLRRTEGQLRIALDACDELQDCIPKIGV